MPVERGKGGGQNQQPQILRHPQENPQPRPDAGSQEERPETVGEQCRAGIVTAALQGGGNGIDPINAIRRATGLSRLRILPADATTGAGTSIAAGKNIGRLYVELITDGQGYSATRVEFQITRWLSLLSTVSTVGRQNVGARVSKDY